MILGSTFTISPLLSSGYDIQPAFLALFDLNSTTLYKSIYGECIYRLPKLAIWFQQAFHPVFLIVSFMIAMIALMMHSFRKLFYAFWVASAIGLCGLDIVFALMSKESVTITYVIQNFVSNIIGSFVLALVLVIIISAIENFFQLRQNKETLEVHYLCYRGRINWWRDFYYCIFHLGNILAPGSYRCKNFNHTSYFREDCNYKFGVSPCTSCLRHNNKRFECF